jgi:hypothetical protein
VISADPLPGRCRTDLVARPGRDAWLLLYSALAQTAMHLDLIRLTTTNTQPLTMGTKR